MSCCVVGLSNNRADLVVVVEIDRLHSELGVKRAPLFAIATMHPAAQQHSAGPVCVVIRISLTRYASLKRSDTHEPNDAFGERAFAKLRNDMRLLKRLGHLRWRAVFALLCFDHSLRSTALARMFSTASAPYSAPCSSSSCTASDLPALQAKCNAVSPVCRTECVMAYKKKKLRS